MPRRRPTNQEVAKLAGVSTAAVSYVFNGRPNRARAVGEETRRKVLEAARQLGYEPNYLARGLRLQRSQLVAFVRTPGSVPVADVLAQQLTTAAAARDYSVVSLVASSAETAHRAFELLQRRLVDGAVIRGWSRALAPGELATLARRGLALTVFDEEMLPDGFDVVRQHQSDGCFRGVAHLIDRGHRRIAYIADYELTAAAGDATRYVGYERAHQAAGLPIDRSLVITDATRGDAIHSVVERVLSRPDPPSAIFCATDRAALLTIAACRDAGRHVPTDVAVMGVGNRPDGSVFRPTLSTVGQPQHDWSDLIDRLFARIDNPAAVADEKISRPWQVIARDSA